MSCLVLSCQDQAKKKGVLGTGQVKKGIFTAAHTCTGQFKIQFKITLLFLIHTYVYRFFFTPGGVGGGIQYELRSAKKIVSPKDPPPPPLKFIVSKVPDLKYRISSNKHLSQIYKRLFE